MSKKQNKKTMKNVNGSSDTDTDIFRFLIILVIICALVIGLYFFSKALVNKRNNNETDNNTNVTIDYDLATVGTIFNRPYSEYYVMVYDGTDDDAMYYSALITKYKKKENALKIYYCDLNNELNKEYKSQSELGNKNAVGVSDLAFGKVTLIKITNGSITNYIEDIEKIKNILN